MKIDAKIWPAPKPKPPLIDSETILSLMTPLGLALNLTLGLLVANFFAHIYSVPRQWTPFLIVGMWILGFVIDASQQLKRQTELQEKRTEKEEDAT